MDVKKVANKMVNDMHTRLLYDIEKRLLEEVETIQYYIMDGYDWLSGLVTDHDSKTNPSIYRDKFESELKSFKYVKSSRNSIKFITPDIDNFDLSELPIIEQILNGTSGTYVEVSQEDMEKITGKTVVNNKPVDPSVSKKNRVYLERDTNTIRSAEKNILKKRLVRFPFSNSPPLHSRVFGDAEEYVSSNLSAWVEEASQHSKDMIMKGYKGVK